MKEILSTEEIDTLLEMFRAEEAELDAANVDAISSQISEDDDAPLISPVNLLKPNRISREHLLSFERYFEAAAKSMAATISEKLRTDIRCDCVAVEQLRLGTWLNQVGGPIAVYQTKMEPLSQPVLFSATTGLLYAAVDRILGGTGEIVKVVKEFTAAEYTVADAFVGPCLDRICESLEEVVKLDWTIEDRFANPALAQIVPPHDVVLAVYFQASGHSMLGDLRMVIPYASLEPYLGKLSHVASSGFGHEPGSMREAVAKSLQEVSVDMMVQLGKTNIPLRQLLELSEGDVVPLSTNVGQDLVAPVQGIPKFTGQLGTRGNRLAFRVGGVLDS